MNRNVHQQNTYAPFLLEKRNWGLFTQQRATRKRSNADGFQNHSEKIQIQDYILHDYVYMKIKTRPNQFVVIGKVNTVFAFGGVVGQFEDV